jgi:putative two-component system response regulator
MATRILIVDDSDEIREMMREALEVEGYECAEAARADDALDILRADAGSAIVLADLCMPGKSGIDLMNIVRTELDRGRDIEFIVVTGHAGTAEAIDALRLGARDFLLKPFEPAALIEAVEAAEAAISEKSAGKFFRESLQAEIKAKELGIHKLVRNLEAAYAEALECLALASEYRDNETGAHIRRIGSLSRFLAQNLGWDSDRRRNIALAAPLHDVGKIGIPDHILLKTGKLTTEEFELMKEHTLIGHRILRGSRSPIMATAGVVAISHHERWDGRGYPNRLAGSDIPVEGRLVAVCDVYDALRSPRPYKAGMTHEQAVAILIEGDARSGGPTHFDPHILDVFKGCQGGFAEIYDSDPDHQL